MCGLFGFSNYSGEKIKNLCELTNSLAQQSTVRGTDATGIAFCNSKGISILKESKAAYMLDFVHDDNIIALTGHTRHSTQGSKNKNYNNHPFAGKCKNTRFALSHNGVLINDAELRKIYRLPKTKIETDSYIAVQLIESQKQLDFDSIRYMAEKTEGSFSYSILDGKNNIYLVKGESPLSILHFPNQKLYVYASTEEILYKALVDFPLLFKELKSGEHEDISIKEGEILKITPNGTTERSAFSYTDYCGRNWWDYGFYGEDYITELKSVSSYYGYSPDDIDELAECGFTPEEIEEGRLSSQVQHFLDKNSIGDK